MSSQMGGIGGGLSGGSGGISGGLAGALESFARRRPRRDPLEGMEEWELLRAAGAPDEVIEASRLKSNLYGPGGTVEASEAIGLAQPDDKKGVLMSVTDFLTRGGSATVGFLTGLTGMERVRDTSEGGKIIPEEDRTVEGGLNLALERFMQGLTGEERFQSADFGVLAYDRETAPTWERVAKSTAGFVLDVALDPLTYMSMGGSIFGRVRGAERVYAAAKTKNRANVLELVDTKNADDILDIVRNTPQLLGATNQKIAAELGEALRARGVNVTQNINKLSMDNIVNILRNNPELARDFAGDMVAANMAVAYRGGSSWGLKSYLQSQFGDAGVQAYRALPMDIQGGVRVRVPFSALGGKDPQVLFRLPGTERLSALTDLARDYFRNTVPGFRALGAEAAGRLGTSDKRLASAYYRLHHDTARRVWGEWVPETGTIGWLDNQAARRSFAEADEETTRLIANISSIYKKAALHIDQGRKAAASEGKDFDRLFYEDALTKRISGRLGDDGSLNINPDITDIFGRNPSEAQQHAYIAAGEMQIINQMILDRAKHVWDGDLGRMMTALGEEGEYFPRIVADMSEMLKGVKRGGSKKPGPLFDRKRFFTFFDEDGTVGNWLTNVQVNEKFGDIFEVAPEKVMMAYMTSMTRAMRDEQITRNLLRSGVAFRGTQVAVLDETKVADGARQVLARMRARQAAAQKIDYVANEADANQVYEALAGWRGVGPRVYTNYRRLPGAATEEIAEAFSSIDGTRIERLTGGLGGFRVARPDGRYLTESGDWAAASAGARLFARRTDAETAANNLLRSDRITDYQDRAAELLAEFKNVIADDLKRLDELNPLSFHNLPLGKDDMEEHMKAIVDVIRDLGESRGLTFYSRPIAGAQYRELTSRSGLAALGQSTASENNVRGQLAARWNELRLLTPAALVDDVQRMGAGQTQRSKWVTDFYLPFYAVQKSLMTSQRGPGYVVRNIVGGMWNAYLFGVRAKHWKGAAVALQARNEAYAWAKKQFPDGEVRQADEAMKKFREILERRLGKQAGGEMFDYYDSFDAMQLGGRSIRSRTMGIRAAELYDDLPDDIVRAIEGEDVSKWTYRNVADYAGSRNRWAQFMTRQATESEDFLRFGSFLRGIDDYGFGDRGRMASMYTLASQFDYTDLSRFEREQLKLVMPFYTWARNNIPLQFRAIASEPGKVLKATRINEAVRDAFGEPGDEEPLPIWVRQRMGWQVRKDLVTGPMGDPLAFGMLVGEPLIDLNNVYGNQPGGVTNLENWRETINSLNPAFSAAMTLATGVQQSTGGTLPSTEPAPPWAEPLVRAGFFGTVTPDGEVIVSSRVMRVLRDTLAPFGAAERLAPQFFGNERYQRRVLSSWASTMFGVPVSTLDPFQTGAELRSRQNRMNSRLREQLGEDWDLYTGWVSRLVDEGATAADMAIIRETVLGIGPNQDIASLPAERIDYTAAADTLDMLRRIERLQELGISESVIRMMWERFEPRTDRELGRGYFSQARQSLPPEVLEQYGLTKYDVAMMDEEQLRALIKAVTGQ